MHTFVAAASDGSIEVQKRISTQYLARCVYVRFVKKNVVLFLILIFPGNVASSNNNASKKENLRGLKFRGDVAPMSDLLCAWVDSLRP